MKTLLIAALLLASAGMAQADTKFKIEQCDHMQKEASREFVKFCLAHGKSEPKDEPCTMSSVKNSPRDVGGGYLEVYDCSWHHGANPRDKK